MTNITNPSPLGKFTAVIPFSQETPIQAASAQMCLGWADLIDDVQARQRGIRKFAKEETV